MTVSYAPDDLLTVNQVASLLQMKPRVVRRRIKDKLLPARKPLGGRSWRIRRADALALLQEPSPTPPAPSPLIDRLGTPEGRARALAMLERLGEDWDAEEQRAALETLQQGLARHPFQLRRWDPETGQQWEEA
ncbi:MAG: helix-turn-helix domain-containing protein [Armatimonadetes bacterium]|nr:helix-turn-helix domain-containing protein [Armatimonadota bacterium]